MPVEGGNGGGKSVLPLLGGAEACHLRRRGARPAAAAQVVRCRVLVVAHLRAAVAAAAAGLQVTRSVLEGAGPGVQGHQQRQQGIAGGGACGGGRGRHHTPSDALHRAFVQVGRLQIAVVIYEEVDQKLGVPGQLDERQQCTPELGSLNLVALHGPQQEQGVECAQLRLEPRAQPPLQQQAPEQARCQPVRLVVRAGAVAKQRQAQRLPQLLGTLRPQVVPDLERVFQQAHNQVQGQQLSLVHVRLHSAEPRFTSCHLAKSSDHEQHIALHVVQVPPRRRTPRVHQRASRVAWCGCVEGCPSLHGGCRRCSIFHTCGGVHLIECPLQSTQVGLFCQGSKLCSTSVGHRISDRIPATSTAYTAACAQTGRPERSVLLRVSPHTETQLW
mmetsp:Transcript_14986/g.45235  ORF Transcript_14986/g.45235 Transcript_14986/m.45235 type:complete len:387 (+) Transcript_14986:1563-2723(+)